MQKQPSFRNAGVGAILIASLLLAVSLTGCNHNNATTVASTPASHSGHAADVPATEIAQKIPHYFEDPNEAKPFPKTLDPATMKTAATKQAYAAARRIPEVLAQQPCYCFCDKGFGHGSLLHCHIDNHSAD